MGAHLERLLPRVGATALADRRWFAGKGRAIATVSLHDHAEIPGRATGELPAVLAIVDVGYVGGGSERYLLPLLLDEDDRPGSTEAEAEFRMRDPDGSAVLREPRDGEGVWAALAELLATGADLSGSRGVMRLRAARPAGGADGGTGPSAAARERRQSGEQSNTSVVVDERFFLKCYRRLDDGLNPEVEVLEFLARHSFDRTPALIGSAIYESRSGEAPSGIAILQELVADARDAWEFMVDAARAWIATDGGEAGRRRAEEAADGIGIVTGRLHAALASEPADARFPVRDATADDRSTWHAAAVQQLEGALGVLSGGDAPVRALESRVRGALAPLAGAGAPATLMRTHGDYHLGQLLQRRDGFVVIDFEGEPARALAERTRPQSPLKDLAGMLRSFGYAAGTARREAEGSGGGSGVARAAGEWLSVTRARFLSAYREATTGAEGLGAEIDADVLRAFEVEKACYEIRYEANNRPDWLWLPLEGLTALIRG